MKGLNGRKTGGRNQEGEIDYRKVWGTGEEEVESFHLKQGTGTVRSPI